MWRNRYPLETTGEWSERLNLTAAVNTSCPPQPPDDFWVISGLGANQQLYCGHSCCPLTGVGDRPLPLPPPPPPPRRRRPPARPSPPHPTGDIFYNLSACGWPFVCPGGSFQDPHLKFAYGGRADFRGLNRHYYNFFSAPRISANIRTEDAKFKLHSGALPRTRGPRPGRIHPTPSPHPTLRQTARRWLLHD